MNGDIFNYFKRFQETWEVPVIYPITTYNPQLGFISYEHSDFMFKRTKYFSLNRVGLVSCIIHFEAGYMN